MLAYGRSKRTLRFSSPTSSLPLSLTAPAQPPSAPPDLRDAEGSERTPDLLGPPTTSGRPTPTARHSPSSPCFRAGTVVFPSHVRTSLHGRDANRSGAMNGGHGGHGGGMYGHQQSSEGRGPAPKRFRLDIDLGSDSDSSCDRNDDRSALPRSFAHRSGELNDSFSPAARGNGGSDIAIGSSGSRPQQRGGVAPDALARGQQRRHETPTHNSREQQQWQAAGGMGGQAWNQPGSASYTSSVGAERGAAGQYLDDDRRESLPFVTPDHAAGEPANRHHGIDFL